MNIARQLATTICLVIVAHAMADNFTIADFSIKQGETKTVSIELNNTESSYIAFEFYMTLPEGISIPEDEGGNLMAELNASRINRHNLEVSRMPDGKYHFLCYSGQNNALQGTSGEIISLTVKAADNATEASGLEGLLSTQKLSDPNKKQVRKTRYRLTHEGQYFQIDLYPMWDDKAILLTEMSEENTPIHFPGHLGIIREVTDDAAYSRAAIAEQM